VTSRVPGQGLIDEPSPALAELASSTVTVSVIFSSVTVARTRTSCDLADECPHRLNLSRSSK
jgi:hypothetical protein